MADKLRRELLCNEIISGEWDDEMELIADWLKERRRNLGDQVNIGDVIELQNIAPKLFVGMKAEVIGRDGGKLRVRMLSGYTRAGRYNPTGSTLTIHPQCAKRIG